MRKNKIGSLFLISVLALAGIGISYAGFTDTLTVYGSVNTATVHWDITGYSSTAVYKVWNPTGGEGAPVGEIFRWHGFGAIPTPAQILATYFPGEPLSAMLVATATAAQATPGSGYDAVFVWNNIFPCQDFTVDLLIHYTGSIPAKINSANIVATSDPDGRLTQLWTATGTTGPAVTYGAYFSDANGNLPANPVPVTLGTQIHTGDYIYAFMNIHIPQDNHWQGLTGTFDASVSIIQWNDYPVD